MYRRVPAYGPPASVSKKEEKLHAQYFYQSING
jgi:hypothetical protein